MTGYGRADAWNDMSLEWASVPKTERGGGSQYSSNNASSHAGKILSQVFNKIDEYHRNRKNSQQNTK